MTTPNASSPKEAATGSFSYTHADFTYVRRKRRLPEDHTAGTGELNIVPFLDILVNLIMFLLVSQATLVSLGVIDVTAPSYGAGKSDSGSQQENTLKLTLGVANEGYFIAATGGVLPGEDQAESSEITPEGVHKQRPTVPRKPDGGFDYSGLTRKLRSIKTVFPGTRAVFFAADQSIPYEVIVKTLDASREDAKGELFPDVAFSKLN